MSASTATAGAIGKAGLDIAKEPVKNLSRRAIDRLKVNLTECFASNIAAAKQSCETVKNILYRSEPAKLQETYVQVSFIKKDKEYSDYSLVDLLISGQNILISGSAGFGKTMFIKWATLRLIETHAQHKLYPVHLELRRVREDESLQNFDEILYTRMSAEKGKATLDQFKLGLEAGFFAVILDAVDEINPKFRMNIVKSIQDFFHKYPKCPVLLSTRPDDNIESMHGLTVFNTKPMDKTQIISVIEKLDYDGTVKNSLIDRLNTGLFDDQKDFLVSPLLATIMLLTFDNSASIPLKSSLFYKEAFETLYHRHDAHKGAFKRGHYAGLAIDDFENIFSYFCYDSLKTMTIEFEYSDLKRRFKDSIAINELSCSPEDVLKDAIESVCLLQKDGQFYTFPHRSFQEYFSARFIINYRGPNPPALIDSFNFSSSVRGAVKILFEMNSDFVEREWFLPKAKNWLAPLIRARPDTKSGLRKFMDSTYRCIGYGEDGSIHRYGMLTGMMGCSWMSIAEDVYGNENLSGLIFRNKLKTLEELCEVYIDQQPPAEFSRYIRDLNHHENNETNHPSDADVDSNDSTWLIHSGIHNVFIEIRNNIRSLVSTIEARQDRLASIISRS